MNAKIIMTCAVLHNFIIDSDGQQETKEGDDSIIDPNIIQNVNREQMHIIHNAPLDMVYRPSMREEDFVEIQGVSNTRRVIVEWLKSNNYKRPEYNMLRNSRWRTSELYNTANREGEFEYDIQYYHPV